LKFERLSLEQGLSQSTVTCILQDSRGFLWVGTHDGLNRYDGRKFKIFRHDAEDSTSISNNYIRHVVEDRDQHLWIATKNGLNRFDPRTERFIRYVHNPQDSNSLVANDIVRLCLDRSGKLWIATLRGGLNRLDIAKKEFARFIHHPNDPNSLRSNTVYSLFEDSRGRLWMGTREGLCILAPDSGKFSFIDIRDEKFAGVVENLVIAIWEDGEGKIGLGTFGGGLVKYDPGSGARRRYFHQSDDPSSLGSNRVSFVAEDRHGNLWLGTDEGLSVFDPKQETFTRYRHDGANSQSLNHDDLWSFCLDRSGVCWIGTNGGGLNKHTPQAERFSHVLAERNTFADNEVMNFCEDASGALWVATTTGLSRWNRERNRWQTFRHDPKNPRGLGPGWVLAVHEDRSGNIWVGTRGGGLHKMIRQGKASSSVSAASDSDIAFERFVNEPGNPQSLSHDIVFTIYEDREGMLWIGTDGGGLNRFDPASKTFHAYRHNPNEMNSLSGVGVEAIYEDHQGCLWVGTNDGGLNALDRRTGKIRRFQHDHKNPNSLSNNLVTSIREDGAGNLWIGTADGLNKLDPAREHFARYFEKHGLPNSYINGILEDRRGHLWLSTNKGLSRLDPATGQFKNFTIQDGLQGNEFNTGACAQSRQGEMFFGGLNGFNRFFPERIVDNPNAPAVVITDFRILGRSVPITASAEKTRSNSPALPESITAAEEITLSYRHNVFSFEFAALDFWAPEWNQYQYMMEGFDSDWIFAGAQNIATYTNLDPGAYVFKARGANSDGVWSEPGASVRLTIAPPFWMTLWFRLLALMGFAAMLALMYSYRVQRLLAMDRLRARIARDLHDDLGSTLNAIAMQAELIKAGVEPHEHPRHLAKIARLSREMAKSLGDVVWSIDARHDRVKDLLDRMREFAHDMLAERNIEASFVITGMTLEKRLAVPLRQNLYLIFKEAINNLAKYSEATKVTVEMGNRGKTFLLKIHDNGKGAHQSPRRNGNGLRNMKMRAQSIDASLEILNEDGWTVSLERKAI